MLVAGLLFVFLLALRRTRTTSIMLGLALLTASYVVAVSLDLRLVRFVFQLLFTVAMIGLIVIFHEEIRFSLERFFSLQLRFRRGNDKHDPIPRGLVDTLVETLTDFARERTGALIVLRGRDDPSRFVRGGFALDGVLSEALLKSIFDRHSLGHDGAVLLSGDRVERFAGHLPLSTKAAEIGKRGTRHAAALGLSEKTDGLCLCVSEERGVISVARHGRLEEVTDAAELARRLGDFYREISPDTRRPFWGGFLLWRNLRLKIAALAAAAILWYVVVHESSIEYRSFDVPVNPVGVAEAQAIRSIEPPRVRVIVSGARRAFYLIDAADFRVDAALFDRGPGLHTVTLTADNVTRPKDLTFVNIAPRNVIVVLGTE